jgi:hypothetical protein
VVCKYTPGARNTSQAPFLVVVMCKVANELVYKIKIKIKICTPRGSRCVSSL